jgi:hypothetical protein
MPELLLTGRNITHTSKQPYGARQVLSLETAKAVCRLHNPLVTVFWRESVECSSNSDILPLALVLGTCTMALKALLAPGMDSSSLASLCAPLMRCELVA